MSAHIPEGTVTTTIETVEAIRNPLDGPSIVRWRWWLKRISQNRLLRRYGWVIIPLIAITIFEAHTHYIYAVSWLGDNQPDHYNNVIALVKTGHMPPPPQPGEPCVQGYCEAFQPPLFYGIIAVAARAIMSLSNLNSDNAIINATKIVLFIMSLIWFAEVICAVQMIMPHRAWLPKALIASASMLIARIVLTNNMETNDHAMMIASMAALIVLYLIIRTDRKFKLIWWWLASAMVALALSFKYSGTQVTAVYAGVAGVIALGFLIRRQPIRLARVVICAALGLPLIAASYLATIRHAAPYQAGGVVNPSEVSFDITWDGNLFTFLTTFSGDALNQPMWGLTPNGTQPEETPGFSSFWSIQYAGLFADSSNRWLPPNEFDLPVNQLVISQYDGGPRILNTPLSIVRYQGVILISRLALPLGLLMAIGLLTTAFEFVRHPRRAMHSGHVLVLLSALATFGSFLVPVIEYHNRDWFTEPRYALFTYVLLLIAGANWIIRVAPKHRGLILPTLRVAFWGSTLVFCAISYVNFWIYAG